MQIFQRNATILGLREIIECTIGDPDDVVADERGALARTVLGMFEAAFPFQHGPARVVVLRELAEDAPEIDLSVAERTETSGSVDPVLIAAIDAGAAVRMVFGVLDVKRADALV